MFAYFDWTLVVALTFLSSQHLIRPIKGSFDPRRRSFVSPYLLATAYSQSIVGNVLKSAEEPINNVIETVSKLSESASKLPYYKFNAMWSRQMQDAVRV